MQTIVSVAVAIVAVLAAGWYLKGKFGAKAAADMAAAKADVEAVKQDVEKL